MKLRRTSNIEQSTPNIEQQKMRPLFTSTFNVGRSMFDVRMNSSARRGFSFAEVMFAVVILGIGFIMVAAVFPVAIRQTQSTGEENTAASAARNAAAAIAAMPTTVVNPYNQQYVNASIGNPMPPPPQPYQALKTISIFPPTVKNYSIGSSALGQLAVAPPAIVVPFVGARWNLLQANLIQNTDPRYSYIPFYRRENNSSAAELIVIAVANRNRPIYDSTDIPSNTASSSSAYVVTATSARQTPFPAASTMPPAQTTICPDTITITSPPAAVTQLEGCTVSIPASTPTVAPYPAVIRTFTLGRALGANKFEIAAGDGLALTAGSNGLWGTDGAVTDPALSSSTCLLNAPSTLQPAVAYVQQLIATAANPAGQIVLNVGPGTNAGDNSGPAMAATGSFVIIADDCPFYPTATLTNYALPYNTSSYQVGALNGRIFRLGQPVVQDSSGNPQAPGTFLLDPSYGMRLGGAASADAYPPSGASVGSLRMKVYLVGAGKATAASNSNTGPAQDIGAFATYIQAQ